MIERALTDLHELIPDLPADVRELLDQIPAGCVTTYGDLARALGDEKTRSARWIGEFLAHHDHNSACPCHRVVRSNGEIGLFVEQSSTEKRKRLRAEKIQVSQAGIVDLSSKFTAFVSLKPLERLRNFQKEIARKTSFSSLNSPPKTIAGVDVAYRDPQTACAAYVLLDATTLEVKWEKTIILPVRFPYIPGYLTFRELPVLLELCRTIREQDLLADVIFVDGNGQLHPWRAGIATCLGVLLDHPVIGVSKSLLCGKTESRSGPTSAIRLPNESGQMTDVGMAVNAPSRASPFYVSVGHRITLSHATELAMRALTKHSLPEPVFLADRLSKRAKKL